MGAQTILVVEDERVVARDLQVMLQRLGYQVPAIADTGADAIAKAAAIQPDLLLMDIRLRGVMDGIDAVERIHAQLDIPVVYLTAFVDDATRQRARQTAPYGYLVKPFDEQTVEITIEMALERHARERRAMEDRQTQRLRVLAGGIAHDFNNLLTVVLGNAELARFEIPDQHPTQESLAQIAHAAQRAADLTSQLSAYASVAPILLEPLDLNALVRQTVASLSGAALNPAAIRLQLAPDLPPLEADVTQIHRAVQHLLINAAEAIGEAGGIITITTELRQLTHAALATAVVGADLPPGWYVAVQIVDTGCGMDEATLARIFDPFFSTKFTGRGLGLPAVLGIVRQHGGTLTVQSAKGQGATFTIFLAGVPG